MDISSIKSHLTITQVLYHYGLHPDKNQRLHCPFHDDKTPSLQIYPKTNTAYCFSSNCKTHGKSLDVIDFIMYQENLSKHESILKAKQIINGSNTGTSAEKNNRLPATGFLENMFRYFKSGLHSSKPTLAYVESRCLDATKIEIGFNGGQFHHGTRKNELLIQQCLQYGLLIDKNLIARTGEKAYQCFGKNCIVFALRNEQNDITGLYFRSIQSSPSGVGGKHFYLKDRTGLYPNYPNKETKTLILTESIIDSASLLQHSQLTIDYSLLACYGTNGLTKEHLHAILKLDYLEEIIFAFDNDEAGKAATEKEYRHLKSFLPTLKFTTLTLPCKDINETLQAHNENVFIHLLENRTILTNDFFFSNEQTNEPENPLPTSNTGNTPNPVNQQKLVLSKAEASTNHSSDNSSPFRGLGGNPNKLHYKTTTADYYIQGGLPKQFDTMKVTLFIQEPIHHLKSRNRIDLYDDKQTFKMIEEVCKELKIENEKLKTDLHNLTDLLDEYREQLQQQEKEKSNKEPPQYALTTLERQQAETFLKQPNVIQRLNELLGKTGIVGEQGNRIFLLLIALSYKMKDPLHALVQGSSGSGKTKIVRQVSDCIPQEQVTRFTRISDKALYNYPQHYFKNRLLIIEDVDGLSEEAELAFRELQSSGELRSSVSIKLENGQITGGEKIVSGPIASMSCTTKGELYEDNMSRVFLIAVDESMEQTKRIIRYQNCIASGNIDLQEQKRTTNFVQNIIRIIEAKEVINPYAEKIQLPEEAHKIRRLNDLFQNFIKMVALVNQYQRASTGSATGAKIIAQIEDIETAIDIMFESIVLKVDELDGSLRQFFEKLKSYLKTTYKEEYHKASFTQREIRHALHLSKAQINRYLQALMELEYLQSSGFINKGYKYKVAYWDNYEGLRKRIKEKLSKQVKDIRHEPQMSH